MPTSPSNPITWEDLIELVNSENLPFPASFACPSVGKEEEKKNKEIWNQLNLAILTLTEQLFLVLLKEEEAASWLGFEKKNISEESAQRLTNKVLTALINQPLLSMCLPTNDSNTSSMAVLFIKEHVIAIKKRISTTDLSTRWRAEMQNRDQLFSIDNPIDIARIIRSGVNLFQTIPQIQHRVEKHITDAVYQVMKRRMTNSKNAPSSPQAASSSSLEITSTIAAIKLANQKMHPQAMTRFCSSWKMLYPLPLPLSFF